MTITDWLVVAAAWLLIPAVLIAKAAMDARQLKSERECWRKIDEIVNKVPR